MFFICQKLKERVNYFTRSEIPQFFSFDKMLLQKFGFWPMKSLLNFRLIVITLTNIMINVVPKNVLAIKLFRSMDFKTFAVVVPELLIHYCFYFMVISMILMKNRLVKVYLNIEVEWKEGENFFYKID